MFLEKRRFWDHFLFPLFSQEGKISCWVSIQLGQEQQEPQRQYQEGYQADRSTQTVVAPSTFSYDQPQVSYPELLNLEQPLQQR
jgi:hypothetical protein